MSEQARATVQAQPKMSTNASSKGSILQRAAVNAAPVNDVPRIVHDVLAAPGQPLDPDTKEFMESRFGHDFSSVRVHTDAKAAESAKSVNALAYTVGKDIAFGTGQYMPGTMRGKQLLSHELTHVVQQRHAPMGPVQMAGGPTNTPLEREADHTSESVMQPVHAEASAALIGPLSQAPIMMSRKEGDQNSAGDVDQVEAEAKQDAKRVKSILQDNNIALFPGNERDIMAIIERWANKPSTVMRTRLSTFDVFIVALGRQTFEVGWPVSKYTNAFDQVYYRMDSERVEQIKEWVKTRGHTFKDTQPNKEVKFEISKEDVIEAVKTTAEIGGAVVEVAGAGLTGGASEIAIILLWLARTLPGLYDKVKAVIDFVQMLRSVKLDDIKNLVTATGIGELLVKALFGEVQSLPTIGKEEQNEQEEKEPAPQQEERGLIKLFHTVMRIIKALKKVYNKVAEFVNQILSTIDITKKEWFKPFSMVYAAIVDAVRAASNPGAVLGAAVSKVREMVGTFFEGLKKRVEDTTGEIKTQVANIGNPAYLLKKISDKAVEMVLNFIITNPPSPAIKLTFKVIEAVGNQSIVELVRKHIPYADELIQKISESSVVQKAVSPLKGPLASVTEAINNISTKATQVIDDSRGKMESLVGDGVQMVKELTGIDPQQSQAARDDDATASEEKKPPKAAPHAGSLKDFLGVIKHGIHTRLLARGEQELVQAGKNIGKAALEKGVQKVKGVAGKIKELLGPKIGFDVRGAHHELWVEEQGEDVSVIVASKELTIEQKLKAYDLALKRVEEAGKLKEAKKLLEELTTLNAEVKSSGKSKSKKIEEQKRKMAALVKEIESLIIPGEEVFEGVSDELGLDPSQKSKPKGLTKKQQEQLIKEAKEVDSDESVAGSYRVRFSTKHPDFPGGKVWQVHHSIPRKFRATLKAEGIDVDAVGFLRGVRTTKGETKNLHAKITTHWENWHAAFKQTQGREPNAAEIIEKAKQVDLDFGHLYWEAEKAAGIPVPTKKSAGKPSFKVKKVETDDSTTNNPRVKAQKAEFMKNNPDSQVTKHWQQEAEESKK